MRIPHEQRDGIGMYGSRSFTSNNIGSGRGLTFSTFENVAIQFIGKSSCNLY